MTGRGPWYICLTSLNTQTQRAQEAPCQLRMPGSSAQKQALWGHSSLVPTSQDFSLSSKTQGSAYLLPGRCWNEMKSSCLETLRSQRGSVFYTKCQRCREKPRTGLSVEWRKACGRSLQTGKEIDREQNTEERTGRVDQGKSFLHQPQSLHLHNEKGQQKSTCHLCFGGCSTTGCPLENKSGDFSSFLTESHQQLLPYTDENRNHQEADLCGSGETLSR